MSADGADKAPIASVEPSKDNAAFATMTLAGSSAPTSPAELNPDVQEFQADSGRGYQSAPVSPNRGGGSFSEAFSPAETRERLVRHLTYYFSPANLIKDEFLRMHMNSELYVQCSLIANFPAIQKLTTDLDLVVELLRTCPNVQVSGDGLMVRPVSMPQPTFVSPPVPPGASPFTPPMASVVLSGEKIGEATESEIQTLFDNGPAPIQVSRDDVGAWIAQFPSEELAQGAAQHVATEKKFQDTTIETNVQVDKNFRDFQQPPYDPRLAYYGGMPFPAGPGYGYVSGMPMYAPYPPQFAHMMPDGSMPPYGRLPGGSSYGNGSGGSSRQGSRSSGSKGRGGGGSHRDGFSRQHSRGSGMDGDGGTGRQGHRRHSDRGDGFGGSRSERGGKGGKKSKSSDRKKSKPPAPVPDLAAADFPALPGGSTSPINKSSTNSASTDAGDVASAPAAWKASNGSARPMADIVKGVGQPQSANSSDKSVTKSSQQPPNSNKPPTTVQRSAAEKRNDVKADDGAVSSNQSEATAGSTQTNTANIAAGGSVEPSDSSASAPSGKQAWSSGTKSVDTKASATAAAVVAGTAPQGKADVQSTAATKSPASVPQTTAATDHRPQAQAGKVAPTKNAVRTDTNESAVKNPKMKSKASASGSGAESSTAAPGAPWGRSNDGGKPSFAEMLKRQKEAEQKRQKK